ncbi:hypothetical protein [uncultured Microbacterium sp.]|uniref:hypothetical protein n=1 Tax=uncultured Microbacterium sp. TaxID=191216 RepID=UPI0035CAF07D
MATKFVLKVLAGALGAVFAALVIRVALIPLLDITLPTNEMRLNFVGSVLSWLITPEALFWYFALGSLSSLVLVLFRVYVPSRGRMIFFVVGFTIAALVYRLNNGWQGDELPFDPAEVLVFAGWISFGLVEWIISTDIVPESIEHFRYVAEERRQFRDQRWIMREREGVELDEFTDWETNYCIVTPHRPMRGLETCTHELDAARFRSGRKRRRIDGEFPQWLKHEGSPGYIEDAAPRSDAEPIRDPLLAHRDVFEDIRRITLARRGLTQPDAHQKTPSDKVGS